MITKNREIPTGVISPNPRVIIVVEKYNESGKGFTDTYD